MKTKLTLLSVALISSVTYNQSVISAELDVQVYNLTHGITFTPVLVAAHDQQTALFHSGESASAALQKMAEGGAIDDLVANVEAAGGVTLQNPAQGMLMAGEMASGMLDTGDNMYLSLTAMLLPTNDGFVGLDSWKIPTQAGTYQIMLNAYDAGTEANDEIINGGGAAGTPGIPAAPAGDGGTGGSGVTSTENNTNVHIHPGNLGDTNASGGISDIDSRVHRWLNPVAKLVITVK
ncbi:spondin domain-containing protein [Catenovulum sediminis]|uniref:Spondin domain-containing protein n=1 Tax=Catenovulum sediminis TaxID=1740262 RepID=A0ABV1RMX7_9ALTE|nr:spondin domain-containing protein [Catenovulum sediminis]